MKGGAFSTALLVPALACAWFLWRGPLSDDRLSVHVNAPSRPHLRSEPASVPGMDPPAGSARRMEEPELRDGYVDMSVRQRGRDLAAPFFAAMSLPDPLRRRQAMKEACVEIAEKEPREALCLLVEHELWDEHEGLLENFTAAWAAREPAAARDWARKLHAGALRDDLIARVAFVQSRAEPAEAARLVIAEIPPGEAQAEAVMSVVHQWARRDVEGASAWIATFPSGALRDRAQAEVAGLRAVAAADKTRQPVSGKL